MPSDGSQRQPRTFDRICSFEMCASNNTYFQHLDVHLHLARIYTDTYHVVVYSRTMQSEFFYRFGKLRLFAGANLIPTWKRVKIEIRNGASIYDIVDTHLIHIQYIYLVPIQYRQATSHPFDRVPILSRSLSRS